MKKQEKKTQAMTAELRGAEGVVSVDLKGARTIAINLSDGGRLDVELFERTPGRLTVRTINGAIVVHPYSSNVVEIEGAFKLLR